MRCSFVAKVRMAILTAALAGLSGTPRLSAQLPEGAKGPGSIVVTLRDSAGNDSLNRASVCTTVGQYYRCAAERAGRRFVISALPVGAYSVDVSCLTRNGMDRGLAQSVVRVADSVPTDVGPDVSFSGCAPRPPRSASG